MSLNLFVCAEQCHNTLRPYNRHEPIFPSSSELYELYTSEIYTVLFVSCAAGGSKRLTSSFYASLRKSGHPKGRLITCEFTIVLSDCCLQRLVLIVLY